jgi:hypothetical protein
VIVAGGCGIAVTGHRGMAGNTGEISTPMPELGAN